MFFYVEYNVWLCTHSIQCLDVSTLNTRTAWTLRCLMLGKRKLQRKRRKNKKMQRSPQRVICVWFPELTHFYGHFTLLLHHSALTLPRWHQELDLNISTVHNKSEHSGGIHFCFAPIAQLYYRNIFTIWTIYTMFSFSIFWQSKIFYADTDYSTFAWWLCSCDEASINVDLIIQAVLLMPTLIHINITMQ